MQRVNEIFNKEVINQTTGEKIATVQDVVLDRDVRHVVALLIPGSGLLGAAQVIRWDSVISVGDVIVVNTTTPFRTVKDDAEIGELAKAANRITGTSVITDKGEQVGSVGDMFVDQRGNIVGYEIKQGLLHSAKYLSIQNVQATGKDAIIATTTDLPRVKDVSGTEAAPMPITEPAAPLPAPGIVSTASSNAAPTPATDATRFDDRL